MILTCAEQNRKIAKEASKNKEKEQLEQIENKFKDFLDFLSKQISQAALDGKFSVRIGNRSFTEADWDDIDWYVKTKHYDTWWWYDDLVIAWYDKDDKEHE